MPTLLGKEFCLQPGLEWKFLLSRTWSGQNFAPTAFCGTFLLLWEGKTGFCTEDSLIPLRIRWKIGRHCGWGSNQDPEHFPNFFLFRTSGPKTPVNAFLSTRLCLDGLGKEQSWFVFPPLLLTLCSSFCAQSKSTSCQQGESPGGNF